MGQAYAFVGDSYAIDDNCYVLTGAVPWQNSSIWYNETIDLNDDFHLQFTVGLGSNDQGADGMVFVMQQVGNNVLGVAGSGIGFSGFSPSLGVEFDTYTNDINGDPFVDHIALIKNGNVNHTSPNNIAGPVAASSVSGNVEDGLDHVVDIFWNSQSMLFSVWFDCVPRIEATVNLLQSIFTSDPNVYWGFTSATGGEFNVQKVCLDPQILGVPEGYAICAGEQVTLESSGAASGQISWEPAQFLDDPFSNTPVATVTETTEFTVSYADLCETVQSESTTVTVFDPQVDLGADLEFCEGEEFSLSVPTGFDDVLWSTGDTGTEIIPIATDAYSVTVTEGECEASDEVLVQINPAPELDWTANTSLCDGETYTIDLSEYPYEFLWSDGDDANVKVFDLGGTYQLEAISGNCSLTYELAVLVGAVPNFSLGADREACDGESISINTQLNGANITWSTGSSANAINVTEPGDYWAMADLNGCTSADTVSVTFLERPNPSIMGIFEMCSGETTTISATGGDSYLWGDGSTSESIDVAVAGQYSVVASLDNSPCTALATHPIYFSAEPRLNVAERILKCDDEAVEILIRTNGELTWDGRIIYPTLNTDEYLVNVSTEGYHLAEAENACGRKTNRVLVVDEKCNNSIFIPNSFTPDADGLNDIFRPQGESVATFTLHIYDRWGKEVFHSDNLNDGWNGNHINDGYYCESGVYVIEYQATFRDESIETGSGIVNLIR